MDAGRDLDALVAQARGWTFADGEWGYEEHSVWKIVTLPSPTSSIADAWELVEELHDFRLYHCASDPEYAGGPEWVLYFSIFASKRWQSMQVDAPTAPEAICRAYLKAKGVEVPA